MVQINQKYWKRTVSRCIFWEINSLTKFDTRNLHDASNYLAGICLRKKSRIFVPVEKMLKVWRKPWQIKSLQSVLKKEEKGINSVGADSEVTLKELSESRTPEMQVENITKKFSQSLQFMGEEPGAVKKLNNSFDFIKSLWYKCLEEFPSFA